MSTKWLVQSPTEKVVEEVNRRGLQNAAKYFLTSPSTLSRWLRDQNYKRRSVYVKVEKTA